MDGFTILFCKGNQYFGLYIKLTSTALNDYMHLLYLVLYLHPVVLGLIRWPSRQFRLIGIKQK
jgi:hypothetical protein